MTLFIDDKILAGINKEEAKPDFVRTAGYTL
jgi:hypothetical protein